MPIRNIQDLHQSHLSGGFCGITQKTTAKFEGQQKMARIAERDESIICSQGCRLYAC